MQQIGPQMEPTNSFICRAGRSTGVGSERLRHALRAFYDASSALDHGGIDVIIMSSMATSGRHEPSTAKKRHSVRLARPQKRIGTSPSTNEKRTAGQATVKLMHPRTGERLKPTLSPKEAAEILEWPERTVRDYARKGLLPTMKRPGSRGQHRIVTATLLEMLGL